MRSYPFFETRWTHIDVPDAHGTHDIWLSEDWDFCEKARSVGIKPYCDTRVLLSHQAHTVCTPEQVMAYKSARQAAIEKMQVELKEKEEKIKDARTPDYVGASVEGANA